MFLFLTFSFFLSSASRDESSEDRQTVSHVSPTKPWAVDGLGLSFAPRALWTWTQVLNAHLRAHDTQYVFRQGWSGTNVALIFSVAWDLFLWTCWFTSAAVHSSICASVSLCKPECLKQVNIGQQVSISWCCSLSTGWRSKDVMYSCMNLSFFIHDDLFFFYVRSLDTWCLVWTLMTLSGSIRCNCAFLFCEIFMSPQTIRCFDFEDFLTSKVQNIVILLCMNLCVK